MLVFSLSTFLLLTSSQAVAPPQSPPAAAHTQPMRAPTTAGSIDTPVDPKERVALGRKVNGLHGLDAQPWHLKATYEVFSADGTSKDKGTFEEWWIHAGQYKLAFHSSSLSLEEYGSPDGTFRTSGQDWPGKPVGMILKMIMNPIENESASTKAMLKNYERNLGTLKLQCTAFVYPGMTGPPQDSYSYCFAPSNAILLYSSNRERVFQTIFENVSLVQGQYVGRQMEVFLVGKRWLSVHIDSVDALGPRAIPDMSVPASALRVNRHEDPAGIVTGGKAIQRAPAEYPPIAKQRRAEGMVVIGATVGIDGHTKNLEILSGPPLLQNAAMDAARRWVYEPYIQNGQPVEADIEINVEFRLD
jgi:TonB family protein